MSLQIIILAAGKGTRMYSSKPKVLHTLAGTPMIEHLVKMSHTLEPDATHIVVGHKADMVQQALSDYQVNFHLQQEQKGTGHAVNIAAKHLADEATVLVMYGDVPLLPDDLMHDLVNGASHNQLMLLTVKLADPFGYGRIVRDTKHNNIVGIVEEKDATETQKKITETNTGILAAPGHYLKKWLHQLTPNNAQNELYLTDIVAMAVADNIAVKHVEPTRSEYVQGVNNQAQLAQLERWYQQQQAQELLNQGVQIADPKRFDVRGDLSVGKDVFIDINCIFEGKVNIGDGVSIGPNCVIKDTSIGTGSQIYGHSLLDTAQVGASCHVGPFARLRPGTQMANKAKVGNFVETKKTFLGEHSKANHFTYLGDTQVGQQVNIGAGTITCNYDGSNKHVTIIEDGAFIGSNTALVAPVTIGEGALVGAGSTITKTVPSKNLAIGRSKQINFTNTERKKK